MLQALGPECHSFDVSRLSTEAVEGLASLAFDGVGDVDIDPAVIRMPQMANFWTGYVWNKKREKVGYLAGGKESYGSATADSLLVDCGQCEPDLTSTGIRAVRLPEGVSPYDLMEEYAEVPGIDLRYRELKHDRAARVLGPDTVAGFFEAAEAANSSVKRA